jgi:hypothetical protein
MFKDFLHKIDEDFWNGDARTGDKLMSVDHEIVIGALAVHVQPGHRRLSQV